tara:strand:+ start:9192 stop:9374 length:183 start_codon:yes stop_codon:yes gene_type:complete
VVYFDVEIRIRNKIFYITLELLINVEDPKIDHYNEVWSKEFSDPNIIKFIGNIEKVSLTF